jgi:hypothetical protein
MREVLEAKEVRVVVPRRLRLIPIRAVAVVRVVWVLPQTDKVVSD